MSTENLRINELSDDAYSWYIEYLTALDAKDIDAYAALLAEDVELVQNNMDPVAGRDTVRAGLSEYWQSFGELEHDLLNIYGSDRNFVLEALNVTKPTTRPRPPLVAAVRAPQAPAAGNSRSAGL